ncbi:sigma-70 family RNA polymerase sigma factor [Paenibacillus lycopersici]|uniref:Sigma-70 family RNA polymerase sigma factor n=1 Tax=Paenibacillus lycopersici TaxID=2704462 RepID=A0A6C0FXQ6_9BACL|nr:sigma-70 family RNA polymerase sigma factor [Paenibacillus lycopersici]QHT59749.1 sigma-70 family RNA polymerase sigma factor [Paenibacillus lycopersici]
MTLTATVAATVTAAVTASANERFTAYYKEHSKRVYAYVYKILRDPFLAQDAVQETFMKIFRKFGMLTAGDVQDGRLYIIARNTAIDLYRKRKCSRETVFERMDLISGAGDGGIGSEFESSEAYEMLQHLDPEQRRSMLLLYGYGMTYEQLASLQQKSIGTLKTQIHRCKKKLQKLQKLEKPQTMQLT